MEGVVSQRYHRYSYSNTETQREQPGHLANKTSSLFKRFVIKCPIIILNKPVNLNVHILRQSRAL